MTSVYFSSFRMNRKRVKYKNTIHNTIQTCKCVGTVNNILCWIFNFDVDIFSNVFGGKEYF